jgi:hypothetical protein
MERQNLFLLVLGSLSMASVISMALVGLNTLDVFVSGLVIVYFVCVTIFRPRRRVPDFIGLALFVAFAYVVALRVLQILLA